jgi:hypothetical protein
MDAGLRARSGGNASIEREAEALVAPSPVILTTRIWVILRESVLAALDVDVGTSSGAGCVAIKAENLALFAPAPLVLTEGCVAVERQGVVSAAAVIVLSPGLARTERRVSGKAEALALVTPFPIALSGAEVSLSGIV